ncbi:hypothetical protein [Dictyobacter vulcani]|uniref:hypothetical protein n=1 Tax=Dictyobacter vulcani TaxID=2607529 RepID=UPI001250C6F9|nr:hypothetical protein [Dictyobacter vulcani]
MPVAPPPRRIMVRDPLREGTGRIHALTHHVAARAGNSTAPTIPGGATALRVVLPRWPAQTQQGGLRVWRPLHVHDAPLRSWAYLLHQKVLCTLPFWILLGRRVLLA